MSQLLGMAAGLAMVVLVLCLLFLFLRQTRLITPAAIHRARSCLFFTLAFFALHAGFCVLVHGQLCGGWTVSLDELFANTSLIRSAAQLEFPSQWMDRPFHLMGKLFFGQYAFGGITLCLLCVWAALFLTDIALTRMTNKAISAQLRPILLVLPGAGLCFFPSAAPFLVLVVALLCVIISRLIASRLKKDTSNEKSLFPSNLYPFLLVLFSLCGAGFDYLLVYGKLG